MLPYFNLDPFATKLQNYKVVVYVSSYTDDSGEGNSESTKIKIQSTRDSV